MIYMIRSSDLTWQSIYIGANQTKMTLLLNSRVLFVMSNCIPTSNVLVNVLNVMVLKMANASNVSKDCFYKMVNVFNVVLIVSNVEIVMDARNAMIIIIWTWKPTRLWTMNVLDVIYLHNLSTDLITHVLLVMLTVFNVHLILFVPNVNHHFTCSTRNVNDVLTIVFHAFLNPNV